MRVIYSFDSHSDSAVSISAVLSRRSWSSDSRLRFQRFDVTCQHVDVRICAFALDSFALAVSPSSVSSRLLHTNTWQSPPDEMSFACGVKQSALTELECPGSVWRRRLVRNSNI